MSVAKLLPLKDINIAIEESLAEIDAERQDEQLGLFSSWAGINRSMGKYWRFNTITLMASKMGMGKSYALNQLHFDFSDVKEIRNKNNEIVYKGINTNFIYPVEILHFGFEMDAKDEVHRHMSRLTGKSHSYLLSSQWSKDSNLYNKITEDEFVNIKSRMNYLKDRPITYVELSGNIFDIRKTVDQFVAIKRKVNPNTRFVITLDHYLLVRKGEENSDGELIANIAYMFLGIRKTYKAMIIILGQMNNNITNVDRMTVPGLNYPNDSDIYWGGQLNWACDNIWIFPYRPKLINLVEYGVERVPTDNLTIASCVKSRRGKIGDIYFTDHLESARFIERTN